MTAREDRISTRACLEDTVAVSKLSGKLGVVTRTWHDTEETPDSYDLSRGDIEVSFVDNTPPLVLHESEVDVVDRSLHLGDVVKRRPEDMMSGIVTEGKMVLTLEHAFTGQKLEDVDSRHVKAALDFIEGASFPRPPDIDDFVIYSDRWLGQIELAHHDVTVRLSNSTLVQLDRPHANLNHVTRDGVKVAEHSLFGSDMFIVGDHVVAQKSNLRRGKWILGEYDPNVEPHGVVVDVRTKMLDVNWLAQKVYGPLVPGGGYLGLPDVVYPDRDPVIVLSKANDATCYQIGDRVRFLKREVETEVYAGRRLDRSELAGFDGNVWAIIGTKTIVDVEWQDGTTSTGVQASDLRIHWRADDYEGWPGEYVSQERSSGGPRFGVIQSVNPQERFARVRFFDEGILLPEIEEVSLYDLSAHPVLQFSLGDHVLLRTKLVAPIGFIEEMINLASDVVENLVRSVTDSGDSEPQTNQGATDVATNRIDWVGEILRINLDGTVKVRLAREADPGPDWTGERYELAESQDLLVIESEGSEGDDDDAYEWFSDDMDMSDGSGSEDEWEDTSEGEDVENLPEASLDGMTDVEKSESVVSNGDAEEMTIDKSPATSSPFELTINADNCPRFDILEIVPDDHPFKSDSPGRQLSEWLARIRREHKILRTSLPEGILVRTYESRLDLLRVLILGPINTPYENAPFLFDFQLTGQFPNEPPVVFFHSWTPGGTSGRVNPNLYVEGRVCLSLLGTWHSHNDSESWNPKQSTLLQVFLSIQSLVLNARPYYNEAGFGNHIDLEDDSVNERLYSERAYFLTRGFVKWALENKVEGLEQEIEYLYLDPNGPQLARAVIKDGKRVIAQSEVDGEDDGEWKKGHVTRVSRGGLQVLKRTISALEERVTGVS